MPVPFSQIPPATISSFTSAASVPFDARKAMQADAANTNTVYPQFLASLEKEGQGQCWILAKGERGNIEMILSCTESNMGTYPIFIVPILPSSQQSLEFFHSRLSLMIESLRVLVPDSRVYSVFGPLHATSVFSIHWSRITGISSYPEPYYDSFLSSCTRSSFRSDDDPMDSRFSYTLELGRTRDIAQIAQLCHDFAKDSVSFCPQYGCLEPLLTIPTQ